MKKITPRISDKTEQFLSENFKTINAGAEFTLEIFPVLFSRTLNSLKGRFTAEELSLMIDVFNTTILTTGIAGQHLHFGCVDSIELDGSDAKWDVDKTTFLNKTRDLKPFEAACLEIWVKGFWQGGHELDQYVKKLT